MSTARFSMNVADAKMYLEEAERLRRLASHLSVPHLRLHLTIPDKKDTAVALPTGEDRKELMSALRAALEAEARRLEHEARKVVREALAEETDADCQS